MALRTIRNGRNDIYEWRGPEDFERIGDLPLHIRYPVISGDGKFIAVLARHNQYPGKAVMWDLFLLDLEKMTQTRTHFREKILEFLRDKMDLRELKYVS